MKIAICDDQTCYIEETRILLEQWGTIHTIPLTIFSYSNGDALIKAQKEQPFDLMILDVLMPLLNGIDTARELRSKDHTVPIIFLTSSKEYAVDSYDVQAFHYVMKPLDASTFFAVMDAFYQQYQSKKETFFARTETGSYNIPLANTEFLEAQNKSVTVHLENGSYLLIKELFSDCAAVFTPEKGFFQCHRSYIVNMNDIAQFTKTKLITKSGITIPISRNHYPAFKEAYFTYMLSSTDPSSV